MVPVANEATLRAMRASEHISSFKPHAVGVCMVMGAPTEPFALQTSGGALEQGHATGNGLSVNFTPRIEYQQIRAIHVLSSDTRAVGSRADAGGRETPTSSSSSLLLSSLELSDTTIYEP